MNHASLDRIVQWHNPGKKQIQFPELVVIKLHLYSLRGLREDSYIMYQIKNN